MAISLIAAKSKDRAPALAILNFDTSVHALGEIATEKQAEATALGFVNSIVFDPIEFLKDLLAEVLGNAWPAISTPNPANNSGPQNKKFPSLTTNS